MLLFEKKLEKFVRFYFGLSVPKVLGIFFEQLYFSRFLEFLMFVLIESATNGLCKTGLSLKIDQAVPKLWLKWARPLQSNVYGKIVYSYYGASNYRTFGAQIANCACAIRILEAMFEKS